MRTTIASVVVLFTLLTLAGAARAQGYPPPPPPGYYAPEPPPGRQGFYIGFSLGMGGLQFTDSNGNETDRESSLSLTILRLGGAVGERFLLGANLGGWGKEFESGETATLVRINFEATYYPIINPRGIDLFLRGGLGLAQLAVKPDSGGEAATEDGAGLQIGIGIEKKLGRSFHLGFGVDWHFAALTEDVAANYYEAAVLFNWY